MKRIWTAWMLAMLMFIAPYAHAQDAGEKIQMQVYLAKDTLDETCARELTEFLGRALPQAKWSLVMQEAAGSLRDLVMADCAPQLAICPPSQARPWAEEGLLLALQKRVSGQRRIHRQALAPCMQEGRLFMAPLAAHRRRMAVNARRFEALRLDYMLDEREYPVWLPAQFRQILEEFAIAQEPAVEIWLPDDGGDAALEALTQAIYGGSLKCGEADETDLIAGMQWLSEMIDCGMIDLAESREEALRRFLHEETAMFIDWTEWEAARSGEEIEERGMRICETEYPASSGLPVRSFELTGVCAFDSGAADQNALALRAVEILHAHPQAQLLLGSRAIWEDDALWLADLSATDEGATLRALYAQALGSVLSGGREAEEAIAVLRAAEAAAQMP